MYIIYMYIHKHIYVCLYSHSLYICIFINVRNKRFFNKTRIPYLLKSKQCLTSNRFPICYSLNNSQLLTKDAVSIKV